MIRISFILLSILSILNLFSCQKVEFLEEFVFDYDQFQKIIITAEKIDVSSDYNAKFDKPYIDHSLIRKPIEILKKWFNNNVGTVGTQNIFNINILEASLKKTEILNDSKKKYKEKKIFLFELNFIVEYILYDEYNMVLANTIVESNRTITSGKNISLNEKERIIDELIFDCLVDFSFKTNELLKSHMKNYIL